VRANDGVNLRVKPGEIHAVLGENGAGKSTLMKIIYGAVQPDEGEIRWNGQPVQVPSPAQARKLGISMVYQHFSLFDTLTAAENVWLGWTSPSAWPRSAAHRRGGAHLRPGRRPAAPGAHAERGRAPARGDRARAADQPAAADPGRAHLGAHAAGGGQALRHAAPAGDEGCSILYISHKLDEIRALCHHCTVLRGGKVTGEVDPAQESNASLSRLMIGASRRSCSTAQRQPGAVVLAVQGLTPAAAGPLRPTCRTSASSARRRDRRHGRRLGQRPAGADGRAVGRRPARAGRLRSGCSASHRRHSPRSRRHEGLHFVPEERLGRGAVPTLSLAQNTCSRAPKPCRPPAGSHRRASPAWPRRHRALPRQGRRPGTAAQAACRAATCRSSSSAARSSANPKLLIVSQPTWGVDVGAAAQIRGELLKLRDAGCAVLVVSEELDELFEISDRLLVIAKGRVSPSVPPARPRSNASANGCRGCGLRRPGNQAEVA
jgi:ABC-type uncharacterized transport system ATPase subunit